jgi:hypothetical protein
VTNKIKTLVLFSACAAVLSMFTAGATTCNSLDGDALTTFLVTGFSCTYGGFTFSDFTYTDSASNGGQVVTAADVTVKAVTNAYGAGLEFNGSWNAFGNDATSDGDVSFTVTALNGATDISDTGLAVTSGVGGTGVATVSEQGCGGVGCTPGTWSVETFQASGPGNDQDVADTTFSTTGSVSVSKDINSAANGIPVTDYATISQVVDTFSVVPEPRAMALMLGFALLAGLALRKKFQSSNA